MTKQTFTQKSNGDTLEASEWNSLTSYVNTAVDAINAIPTSTGGSGEGLPNLYINSKGNLNLETSAELGNTSKGKINIEAMDDIQLKPGDDIILYSHHRAQDKQDEVAVKVTDGNDIPVKLQLNAAEMVVTTKDKTGNNANVFDVTVNSDKNTRGYLKVRAQAIDLRSETHGGIALQPKGTDSDGNMNKIKFEHGGGDGLEFGTFNTEKTSIFTDEYRFNKDGVWKMATRVTEASDKADVDDDTTALKYVKQADDFYDVIDSSDEQATTKDIIKTAYAMNGGKDRHTKITNKGAVEIATNATYTYNITSEPDDVSGAVNISTISTKINTLIQNESIEDGDIFNDGDFETSPTAGTLYTDGNGLYFAFTENAAPDIKIDSGGELKLGGILDFGSSFNFGETDNGIEFQYKLTKKNATKDCGVLKVVGVNNNASNNLVVEGQTIAPGNTEVVAQCSVLDMIKLVNYMKTNNEGPWESQLLTPVITLAKPTYTAYVGEIDKIVATIAPSSLQYSLKYVSENASELGLSSDGYIEPTTVGNYYVNVVFEGNAQYDRVSVRVPVTVMAARDNVSLVMNPELTNTWSISNNIINNNVVVMEVSPSEPIANAVYHWSTYPAGVLNFTPVDGHPDSDAVVMSLVDPNYTGTFTIFVEYDGSDTVMPADASHSYTITA